MFRLKTYILILLGTLFATTPVFAATTIDGHDAALTFLWIAAILFIAKISSFIEKFGQPAVLGELIVGVILGNLVLLGLGIFEPIKNSNLLAFMAEIGVVILLFQIGLESNISEMRKVGLRALIVALIGVVAPFAIGTFLIGPLFFGAESFNTHLFIGAALTATSVGITGRVFKDLGKINSQEAKIVLGASVIDDILGLIMLAVVSAIVITGSVHPSAIFLIIAKAVGFLAAAVIFGQTMSLKLTRFITKIQSGISAEFAIALSMGLFFAYLADLVGLAPIVGAFAAGLILDEVHFNNYFDNELAEEMKKVADTCEPKVHDNLLAKINKHSKKRIEDVIEPLGFFFTPIFFVITGMNVNLDVFSSQKTILIALIVTVLAIIGKLISGLAAGKVNKLIVGLGMVPRGEVGLIFAAVGQSLGVIDDELFSIIVLMVIITTLLTPVIISSIYQKYESLT